MTRRIAMMLSSALFLIAAPAVRAQEPAPVTPQPSGTYPHQNVHPYGHDDPQIRRAADPFERRHAYLGAQAVFFGRLGETAERDYLGSGGGFEITLGGRVHRRVALELNWLSSFQSDRSGLYPGNAHVMVINGVTFDTRIFFLTRGRFQPYATVGGGAYILGKGFASYEGVGPGFEGGGGIDFWLSKHVTLGLNAKYRGIGLINAGPLNEDNYISVITLGGDVTARF